MKNCLLFEDWKKGFNENLKKRVMRSRIKNNQIVVAQNSIIRKN